MIQIPSGSSLHGAGPIGVRYSLPDLLLEVKLERDAPAFAMEKLEQVEIAKLFAKNRPRRAVKPRQ
jgi:hypothetical protein